MYSCFPLKSGTYNNGNLENLLPYSRNDMGENVILKLIGSDIVTLHNLSYCKSHTFCVNMLMFTM